MFGNEDSTITGVFSARDPPDLIPNSEVKTRSGDGTWLAGAWESIAMPVSKRRIREIESFFIYKTLSNIDFLDKKS